MNSQNVAVVVLVVVLSVLSSLLFSGGRVAHVSPIVLGKWCPVRSDRQTPLAVDDLLRTSVQHPMVPSAADVASSTQGNHHTSSLVLGIIQIR